MLAHISITYSHDHTCSHSCSHTSASPLFSLSALPPSSQAARVLPLTPPQHPAFCLLLSQALRTHERSTRPLYVSVGHRISLEAAVRLTLRCCRFKSPEPVRQVGQGGVLLMGKGRRVPTPHRLPQEGLVP